MPKNSRAGGTRIAANYKFGLTSVKIHVILFILLGRGRAGINMSAYDELYVAKIKHTQGKMFFHIREEFPGADEKWFIKRYMKSDIRKFLDHANPKLAAKPAPELIHAFINRKCGGEYKRGEQWGGFLLQWVGEIYSLYQWKYEVPSAKLIDILPLSDMERMYIPGHQMGWDAAVKKIHDVLVNRKIQKGGESDEEI